VCQDNSLRGKRWEWYQNNYVVLCRVQVCVWVCICVCVFSLN